MSELNTGDQLNNGLEIAGSATLNAGKKATQAGTKGVKTAGKFAKFGAGAFNIKKTVIKYGIILLSICLILLLILIAYVVDGLASSTTIEMLRRTAINETPGYNNPANSEEKAKSMYDIQLEIDDTVKLVEVIHEAKQRDMATVDSAMKKAVEKEAARLQKSGITVDVDLSIQKAKREEAKGSGYMYVQGSLSGTSTGSAEINVLVFDDTTRNDGIVKRLEKEGCKVTTSYKKSEVDPNKYDALVIPGGHNVTPSLYGEKIKYITKNGKKIACTTDNNIKKDKKQIEAVKKFADAGKPVLGLCRGCQLINVAYGGTIDQGDGTYHKEMHNISLVKGTWFYEVHGSTLNCFHYHKQQVKDVAPGFKIAAWGKKGNKKIIEGIIHESRPIYCTQWHPDADKAGKNGQKLIAAFVKVIKEKKGMGTGAAAASGSTSASAYTKKQTTYTNPNPAIQGAIDWAINIANDDSFCYGLYDRKGGAASHCGCYFCGTNDKKVKKSGGDQRYKKTYMCMGFITAAYAHGAGDEDILHNACEKYHCLTVYHINSPSSAAKQKYGKWIAVGAAKNLKAKDLQAGDVLIWKKKYGHMAMYLDNTHVVDAGGYDNGWTARTIAVREKSWKDADYVIRYAGNGTGSTWQDSVASLPTYDTITSLKTLSKGTGKTVKINPVSGYSVQSFAYNEGKYYVLTAPSGGNGSDGYIHRLDSNGKEEKVSPKVLETGHGNGLAYNTENNKLYSVTVNGIRNNKKTLTIDPNELTGSGHKNLRHGTSSIGFDRTNKRFITSSGAVNGNASSTGHLYVYESNLSTGAGAKTISKMRWDTPGDIAAYNGVIFVTISGGASVFGKNHIDMYNEETGNYLGSYDCPYDEIEGIDIDGNGQIVLLFHGATDYLQFTGITAPGGTAGIDTAQMGISVLDMDILSAYNVSISNSDTFLNRNNISKVDNKWWLDKKGYRDVSDKRLPIYWFGKNRGMIKYPKDLKKKLNKIIKGSAVHTNYSSGSSDSSASVSSSDWNLLLVNNNHAIPDNYTVNLKTVRNGKVDERIADSLEKMLKACEKAGYSPKLISWYRTNDEQKYLYDHTANKADTAVPGHSEHECGLAVDIVDGANQSWSGDPLIDAQADLPAQKWLMSHCQNYGFILRYPKGKQDITGIIWEPWHYRYVGKEHAKAIMSAGITLEEYLGETAGNTSSAEDDVDIRDDSKHFYKVVLGSKPEAINTTDDDGNSVTKYIIPVTVKEKDVDELMEPLFGLEPDDDYTNSKTSKTAKKEEAKASGTIADAKKTASLFNIPGGTATNLTATYSISDNTGRTFLGDPQVALKLSEYNGNGVLKFPLPEKYLKKSTITSHCTNGELRKDVNTGRPHDGLDLGVPTGTPIYAALPGTVIKADYHVNYGNHVVIETKGSETYEITYAHMSKILCKKGDYVQAGATIGLVGSTGFSTGPHLHFEVHKNGKIIDPEPLLGFTD